MKKSGIEPPEHLSAESKLLWSRLTADYGITDTAGLLMVRSALEAHDRLSQAREVIAREGILQRDRFGQLKQHPATLVERDARTQLLASLRLLKLEPGEIES